MTRVLVTSKPAFLLGVTGTMSFPGYSDDPRKMKAAALAVRARVRNALEWLVAANGPWRPASPGVTGALDPGTGAYDRARVCSELPTQGELPAWWRPVGLRNTPIVLLSSLAPGVDTLAAEAALDFASQAAELGVPVLVRAPLPFPLEVYRESSTFRPSDAPETWDAKRERLDALLQRLRAQPGFVQGRDIFCVALDERLEGDPRADLTAMVAPGKARRHLRYRAAGEYVATHSHLMLAAYDEREEGPDGGDDLFACGARAIVAVKRRGATHGLLALANSVAWADNGPVLRIPLDGKHRGDGEAPCARPLSFLHPIDARPELPPALPRRVKLRLAFACFLREKGAGYEPPAIQRETRDDAAYDANPGQEAIVEDQGWSRAGDAVFRRIASNLEELNGLPEDARLEGLEIDSLLQSATRAARIEESEQDDPMLAAERKTAWKEARAAVAGLADLAAIRRRASASADEIDDARRTLFLAVALLLLLSAGTLAAFGSWSAPTPLAADEAGGEVIALLRVVLLATSVVCLLATGLLLWRFRRDGFERKRFDYRALSEGLRVQFYWSAAGIHAAAASEYSQRHRGEMLWIRHALLSAAMPLERWRRAIDELRHPARTELLRAIHAGWIVGQIRYTREQALPNEERARCWRHWGWSLAGAGLLNVVGQLVATAIRGAEHAPVPRAAWIAGCAGALGLAALGVQAKLSWSHPLAHGPDDVDGLHERGFLRWVVLRPLRWGLALVAGALAFWLAHVLAALAIVANAGPHWPSAGAWWVIGTGVLLLLGGTCLGWTDRKAHVEKARSNQALRGLYESAHRRLGPLIESYGASDPAGADAARKLAEIRSLLVEIGREALSENAEWLILHRIRPLDPYLP